MRRVDAEYHMFLSSWTLLVDAPPPRYLELLFVPAPHITW